VGRFFRIYCRSVMGHRCSLGVADADLALSDHFAGQGYGHNVTTILIIGIALKNLPVGGFILIDSRLSLFDRSYQILKGFGIVHGQVSQYLTIEFYPFFL
jgi:hypothetical protein